MRLARSLTSSYARFLDALCSARALLTWIWPAGIISSPYSASSCCCSPLMSWAICWASYCSAAICCSGLPLLYAAAPSEATCCCIICTSRTKEEPGCEKDKWNQHCARKLAFKAPPHLLSLSNTVASKKQWRSKEHFLFWFDKQVSSHR